jgi:hypothetical protein
MDGLTTSEIEMPLPMKLALRTMLNNLWRFDDKGENKTHASGDWIVFTTNARPTDVQKFYTNDHMASFGGWKRIKENTCLDGKEYGVRLRS